MKMRILAAFALAAVLISGACSSSSEEKSAKTNSPGNGNTAATAVNTGDSVASPVVVDANSVNAASGEPIQSVSSNRLDGKLQALRDSGGPIDNAKIAAMAAKNARPAPDNSTFFSYLTDAGYEVRNFKNHSQLAKVEKRVATDSQVIKVFLRDGRVIELPGDSISVLATATANAILAAAGVEQTAVPQKPTAGAPSKKSAN